MQHNKKRSWVTSPWKDFFYFQTLFFYLNLTGKVFLFARIVWTYLLYLTTITTPPWWLLLPSIWPLAMVLPPTQLATRINLHQAPQLILRRPVATSKCQQYFRNIWNKSFKLNVFNPVYISNRKISVLKIDALNQSAFLALIIFR